MRAVEDGDHAVRRRAGVHAPQEVVPLLDLARRLEAHDLRPLRVERGEHALDDAVLPRRVAPLQHDEQRAPSVGEERRLKIRQPVEQLVRRVSEIMPIGRPARRRGVGVVEAREVA